MWHHLINWLKEYFGFSLRETRGFLVLLLLMVVVLVAGSYWPYLPHGYLFGSLAATTNSPTAHLDSLLQQMQMASARPASSAVPETTNMPTATLYPFDPDTLDAAGWERVGAPAWLAARIVRYKGDRPDAFRSIADLQRIYNFPEDLLANLEPYLLFPQEQKQPLATATTSTTDAASPKQIPARPARELIRLNSADTTAFKQIRGIGSKLSARIVSFREKLGGFHSAEQVREVYGLPPEVADALLAQAELDRLPLRQLQINTATAEQLAAHPYLPWKTARMLVAYREQHGPFANAEQLKNVKEIDQEALLKALPYLSFE